MPQRKKFLLRLDQKLWDEINAWAGRDLRSVNGQIEYILREAVRRHKREPQIHDEEPARGKK